MNELYECKATCESNKLEEESPYLPILMKISRLTLAIGKYKDSIANTMSCLKYLKNKDEQYKSFQDKQSAALFLGAAELLLRAFELTKKRDELKEVGSMCLERCQYIKSAILYKRLFKIVLFPYLKRMGEK